MRIASTKPESWAGSRVIEVISPEVTLPPPLAAPVSQTIEAQSVAILDLPQSPVAVAQKRFVSPQTLLEPRLPHLNQPRTVVLAGVAIAVSSAGMAGVLTRSAPEYEGRFYLTTSETTASPRTVEMVGFAQPYSAIAPPTANLEQRVEALTSAAILEPAIAKLQAEGIEIDYRELVDHLTVIPTDAPNVIEVSYRAKDAQHLQTILEKVAETYTQDNQPCDTQTCRNLAFVNAQLPSIQARIETLQTNLSRFQQQHQIATLQAQHQQTVSLKTQLERQIEQTQAKLDAATDQANRLTTQLEPYAQSFSATRLLAENERYQLLMGQLRSIETVIAGELQQPQIQQHQLQPLYEQYQSLVMQLREQANEVANQFLINSVIGQTTPLAQQLPVVQQWVEITHQVEILRVHHQSLTQLKQNLSQRNSQSTILLEQYTHLQQQLQDANTLLEQYAARRQQLEIHTASENSWDLVTPPELLQTHQKPAPIAITSDMKRDIGMGLLLGSLLGVGVAAVTEGRDRQQSLMLSHEY